MKLKTEKFGVIEYTKKDIAVFMDGLLGFENLKRYVFVEKKESAPFVWFHCVDDKKTSFVAINPYLFFPDYKVQIQKEDHQALGITKVQDVILLTLVVVPASWPEDVSTNLLAPILINKNNLKSKQIILHNSGYSTKHFLMKQGSKNLETISSQKVA